MASARSRELSTSQLIKGIGALTPEIGAFYAQACSICLDRNGHTDGIRLTVNGEFDEVLKLRWTKPDERMKLAWANPTVATEHGAYGIAILLIFKLTPYTVIETACKGTGIDYWLGYKTQLPFQKKARLEVSGIDKEKPDRIRRRMREKVEQTKQSDGDLPAYVVIVEFGGPESLVTKR